MTGSNKSSGTTFERAFALALYGCGFWVHLLRQSEAGQPADVIACREGSVYLIDCKDCAGDRFDLSRIEENQELAMTEFEKRGNGPGWFAVHIGGETYMLSILCIEYLRSSGKESIKLNEFGHAWGTPINDWVTTVP